MMDHLANIQSEENVLAAVHHDLSTITSRLQKAAGRTNSSVKRKAATPTVDSDDAAIDCVVATTVDLNSKSELDFVAGNTLNEHIYPGGRSGVLHKSRNMIPMEIIAETQAHSRLRISNDILDAEQALRTFDNALLWGPKSSVTRFERLVRLRKYSTPAGWDWVDAILERFPVLGNLKAHEQYQEHAKSRIEAEPSKFRLETRGMSEICPPEILSAAPAVDALGPIVLTANHSHLHGQQPCKIKEAGMPLFTHTLPNVGNTCFFNSVLQVIASLSSFVAEIEKAPLPPNFDDSSYCLAFLKLFIPAIAAPSSEPSIQLDMSSVTSGDWRMCHADWIDFVLRLTTKYDSKYALGAFADPGDLLDYFLSIVPGAERMCSIDFKWITTLRCKCQEQQREQTVRECGITLSVDSDATLIHHILRAFSPDDVCDYRCDQCQAQSSSDRPATRQRLLLSLPRFLRINVTASLTSEALPVDFHRHGPLREYETLDLSQLTPQPLCKQAHYTLRAAI